MIWILLSLFPFFIVSVFAECSLVQSPVSTKDFIREAAENTEPGLLELPVLETAGQDWPEATYPACGLAAALDGFGGGLAPSPFS